METRNFQKEMEKVMNGEARGKRLLLHACCAPCSSACLEKLRTFFSITVFYYNPNITLSEEYAYRLAEEKRLIEAMNGAGQSLGEAYPISILEGKYEPERYLSLVKGYEKVQEGGSRCELCFRLRLGESARVAKENGFDYFTTTLTISPLKNAAMLNAIGEQVAKEYDVMWLPSDFKKKDGYKRSIELSKEYDLYRQDYCGCVFSKEARESTL